MSVMFIACNNFILLLLLLLLLFVVAAAVVVLLVLESPFPILNVFSEQKNQFNGGQSCMIFSSHQVEKLGLMIVTEHQ